MASMGIVPATASEASQSHPEEMHAAWEMRIGNAMTLQASARITPAGVICVGLAAAAITVAACFGAALIRRAGR